MRAFKWFLASLLLPALLSAQPAGTIPTTAFTRDLLRSPDAATARTKLEIGGGGTNGISFDATQFTGIDPVHIIDGAFLTNSVVYGASFPLLSTNKVLFASSSNTVTTIGGPLGVQILQSTNASQALALLGITPSTNGANVVSNLAQVASFPTDQGDYVFVMNGAAFNDGGGGLFNRVLTADYGSNDGVNEITSTDDATYSWKRVADLTQYPALDLANMGDVSVSNATNSLLTMVDVAGQVVFTNMPQTTIDLRNYYSGSGSWTHALTNAINALPDYGTLVMPNIGSNMVFDGNVRHYISNKTNVRIIMDAAVTITPTTGSDAPGRFFVVDNCTNLTLTGSGLFDGIATQHTSTNSYGKNGFFTGRESALLTIEDVKIKDCGNHAISIVGGTGHKVKNVTIRQTGGNTDPEWGKNADGIHFYNCSDVTAVANDIESTDDCIAFTVSDTFGAVSPATSAGHFSGGLIANNMLKPYATLTNKSPTAIRVSIETNDPTNSISNVEIIGNTIVAHAAKTGIIAGYTGNPGENYHTNLVIVGNTITDCATGTIEIGPDTGNAVASSTVYGGISMSSTKGGLIGNNTITRCQVTGVYLRGTEDAVVTGNIISDIQLDASNRAYGVSIDDNTDACTNTIIANNLFDNIAASGVFVYDVSGTYEHSQLRIAGNTFQNIDPTGTSQSVRAGIYCNKMDWLYVENNNFLSFPTYGIIMYTTTNAVVRGNNFAKTGSTSAVTDHIFAEWDDSSTTTDTPMTLMQVIGNTFAPADKNSVDIRNYETTLVLNNTIQATNTTTPAVYLRGTGTGASTWNTTNRISGNVFIAGATGIGAFSESLKATGFGTVTHDVRFADDNIMIGQHTTPLWLEPDGTKPNNVISNSYVRPIIAPLVNARVWNGTGGLANAPDPFSNFANTTYTVLNTSGDHDNVLDMVTTVANQGLRTAAILTAGQKYHIKYAIKVTSGNWRLTTASAKVWQPHTTTTDTVWHEYDLVVVADGTRVHIENTDASAQCQVAYLKVENYVD